uniref:Uncharacterized protein n=1 Tax=Anguilla anguilla TaxID=7936 RepID=A0A0E9XAB5_ANGAN
MVKMILKIITIFQRSVIKSPFLKFEEF